MTDAKATRQTPVPPRGEAGTDRPPPRAKASTDGTTSKAGTATTAGQGTSTKPGRAPKKTQSSTSGDGKAAPSGAARPAASKASAEMVGKNASAEPATNEQQVAQTSNSPQPPATGASLAQGSPAHPAPTQSHQSGLHPDGDDPDVATVDAAGADDGAETALDETGLDETAPEDAALDETGLDETGLDETGLDETGLDETGLDETGHAPTEITYAENFYAARPRSLRPRARLRTTPGTPKEFAGEPVGTNPDYVAWLREQSMLDDAKRLAAQFSGLGSMWQNPFANPNPRAAIESASVWFTAYPISMISRPRQSFLSTLGDLHLWKAFQQIGIDGIHTGPVKMAGGITGWSPTPSVDGHFDRISTRIDPAFGTEEEFRAMCEVAAEHGGTVIDDIVPGHTGKGADFRLAEMNVEDFPGIYHMVHVPREDWELLPQVPQGMDSVNLDAEAEKRLAEAGYIVGEMQRVIFYDPGVKDTNWSATDEVVGPDGIARRWVYLHYFKQGQPSINWLDPTFAGMRLVIGDALHSLGDLGSGALRLDANGFLGVEKSTSEGPAWSEGHPLSEGANQIIASMVRKVGGFTFQELNLTIDDIRSTSEQGADLSYDFINRPGYQHALVTGDTEFLRLCLNESLRMGVDPASLVHALQNHDELTYELVHWATLHADERYLFRGAMRRGGDIAVRVRQDMLDGITGEEHPYNKVFTTNGIASTCATVIAGALGVHDLAEIDDDLARKIKQAHLVFVAFNALQPGVFALSGWDLMGMLTVDESQIMHLLATGDTRWVHRGAYDLMGFDPDATASGSGMPLARSLYGPLPDQLTNPNSFVSSLQRILAIRKHYGIATARMVDVPAVAHKALLVLVNELDGGDKHVLVLNFGTEEVPGIVISTQLAPGSSVQDMATEESLGEVSSLHSVLVSMPALGIRSLLVREPEPVPEEDLHEGDLA
ncbi:MAG: maltose alpha-D-glucosyltransferase [Actinomycetales bacterium]